MSAHLRVGNHVHTLSLKTSGSSVLFFRSNRSNVCAERMRELSRYSLADLINDSSALLGASQCAAGSDACLSMVKWSSCPC